jgi:predicted HicB family RNase H-like nuclease
MTYKGYSATMIELDEDSGTIFGRLDLVRGMATFEGTTVAEAIQAFRDTVDDYLDLCAKHGIEPESPARELATGPATGRASTAS